MPSLVRRAPIVLLFSVYFATAMQAGGLNARAANAFPAVERSLALIGSVGAGGHLDSEGTAFCVSSDASHSYLITNNHVVTDDHGAPLNNLIVILAQDMQSTQAPRYLATIIRRSEDPDLAIVAIDVPNLPSVSISASLPAVGDDIAIAGFPYEESFVWGRLFGGKALRLDRPFPPELTASEHKGAVSAIHGGSYYIQYDALTDSGNSGGPLFDPSTGEVFGVVQASIPGAPEYRGIPSSVRNNLAISIREGWRFIARAPISLGATVVGAGEHFARRDACGKAQSRFEQAYGTWARARSAAATLRANIGNPRYATSTGLLRTALRTYDGVAIAAEHRMHKTIRGVERRSLQTAFLDRNLLSAITAHSPFQGAIARAAHKLNGATPCT